MQSLRRLSRGLLIVFEGLDGAGKTTQTRLLYAYLQQQGYKVRHSREPTNGPWGQKIRQLIQQGRHTTSPETELEWFIRDRRENVEQHILPALARRHIVLLDRYYFSTMAYQGALGLDPQMIQQRNEAFAPPPDLLFLLDIDPAQGWQRILQRGGHNTFEHLDYLERVAEIFATLTFPALQRLPATLEPDAIHARVRQAIQPLLCRFTLPEVRI